MNYTSTYRDSTDLLTHYLAGIIFITLFFFFFFFNNPPPPKFSPLPHPAPLPTPGPRRERPRGPKSPPRGRRGGTSSRPRRFSGRNPPLSMPRDPDEAVAAAREVAGRT